MGFRNREIEYKFLVGCASRTSLDSIVQSIFKPKRIIYGSGVDVYWKLPKRQSGPGGDFIRVRQMDNGRAQITVKHSDKGNIRDRVEIDVEVESASQAIALMNQLYGERAGMVQKSYSVFFLDAKDTVNISTYKVLNDKRVFLEVEARSERAVSRIVDKMNKKLGVKMTQLDLSLFDLFVAKKKLK